MKWVLLLAPYAVAAAAVPLVGYSLPPCFGNSEGRISAECMAHWEAAMPAFPDRFVYALGVPMSAAVTFLALIGTTVVAVFARRHMRRLGA